MTETVNGQRHDRSALVLYGSETGNSQDVAEELGRIMERLHFETRVSEMDLVQINTLLECTVVVFAISTTGQGEFPKNARKFWKSLLRRRLPPDCLNHVSFTIFGLGDSSYPKFNWSARKLQKRIEQLGANEVYPRGEGDEQHPEGVDGTFLPWSLDFRQRLLASYPLPEGVNPIPQDVLLPPKHVLRDLEKPVGSAGSPLDIHTESATNLTSKNATSPSSALHIDTINKEFSPHTSKTTGNGSTMLYDPPVEHEPQGGDQLKGDFDGPSAHADLYQPPRDVLSNPQTWDVKIIENKRVTPENHWQDVRLLTFITNSDVSYLPGDAMVIFPKNFPNDVQTLIGLQGWDHHADLPLTFEAVPNRFYSAENLIPGRVPGLYPLPNTTLRQLLIHNLDFNSIPKRHFFEIIAHYTHDPTHKDRLLEFTSPAFTDEFFDYTTRPRRTMLEVLQDFPSVQLPWKEVTSIFPVIRGRKYSIASGGAKKIYEMQGKSLVRMELLVALVKYRTVLKKVRQGLCSRYIASLVPGTVLGVEFDTGDAFYELVKKKPHLPTLMIAPGTGVAPCRALLYERAALGMAYGYEKVGHNILIFGNRNKNADYFFAKEWGYITLQTQVFTAFSRDQKEKRYVQDVIREQGEAIWKAIQEQAVIYVCGSSGKMPLAVREAIIDVMLKYAIHDDGTKVTDRKVCEEKLAQYDKRGHYVQETW